MCPDVGIAGGGARAVVTERGSGLRAFEVDGIPYCETYPADQEPPMGVGAVLIPWPNRVAAGRWGWRGEAHQLAITEPERGHAIHGLLRHALWRVVRRAAHAVELDVRISAGAGWPQPLIVRTSYRVDGDGLSVSHRIRNDGVDPVPVGVGTHPYLRVGDVPADELTLRLSAGTVLPVDDRLIPSGPPRPVGGTDLDLRSGRRVGALELDTAFGGCTRGDDALVRHELRAPDGTGVELWADPAFRWVQVFTPHDFPRAGRGPGRAVAIEPMTCPPDALNSHVDLTVLAPRESWTVRWGLRPLAPQ